MVIKVIKERIINLQNILNDGEAFLITSGSNRFYLTGFNSSAGAVYVSRKSAVFFIDFRYYEKAKNTIDSCQVRLFDKGDRDIASLCGEENIKTIFVETNTVSLSQHSYYCNLFEGIEISKQNKLDQKLNEMRSVKTKDELSFITAAQKLTDQTFNYICERIAVGRSERDIMLDMEFFMRKLGAEGVSFDFIVVSGKNSSMPHGVPTEKIIEKGDFITMDFGAVAYGYCSDMTRTVAVGNISAEQKTVYDTVLKAQTTACTAIKAGINCGAVDKIARDIIYDAGYTGCFGHSLGHGVGIDIHESPNLSPNNTTVLKTGNVVTVEPGIYIENKFGVRIEDMVCVTDDGCINLTKSDKKLIVL